MENQKTAWDNFANLSAPKQIGIIGSITFGIALIIGIMFWGMTPNYRVLYSNLDGTDTTAIMDHLSKKGIAFKLNETTGAILVPRDVVYKARLNLSAEGLPSKSDNLDFFDSGQRMGLSKNMETARLKKMMELELAKSINKIKDVNNSSVHIAIPPNSVFSRERGNVTASIIIDSRAKLSNQQIKSIVALVSRSVPRLEENNISVVDTAGNLLSTNNADGGEEADNLKNKMELTLQNRVSDIIGKIVGDGNVSAKVSIELDFSKNETTSEVFAPASGQVRSEQWEESVVNEAKAKEGQVPGALTNQPLKTDVQNVGGGEDGDEPVKKKDGKFTKNYELDKTIIHKKNSQPDIRRITVAVIVNVGRTIGQDGKISDRPRTTAEILEYEKLARNTVGFNKERGDQVVVISRKFEMQDFTIDDEKSGVEKWYEMPIVLEGGKWGTVLISILLIIFLIIRPLLKAIFAKEEEEKKKEEEEDEEGKDPSVSDLVKAGEEEFADEMAEVRKIAGEDPDIVAQVVKQWITEDGDDDD